MIWLFVAFKKKKGREVLEINYATRRITEQRQFNKKIEITITGLF